MRLTDTLTGELVELPAPPAKIGMYVCGPTVYQRAHIGNGRSYVVFSWLAHWLRYRGYEVTFVHNITDVDDKILAMPGPSAEVATQATGWYLEDIGDFGLELPDELPRATETIPEIIRMIEQLVGSGHAYDVAGDVYFRVASYPEYGVLSGQRSDEVAEQEPNPRKEDPRDFALWKANKPGEDMSWESPWGAGRPGWHIECSAMAEKLLGPSFEIHGSGRDIVFPHNENERAQSRALGSDFARIWMHNGMLRVTGEKMSKSVGNIATIQDVLAEWGAETTLLFFMTAHWRKPIDFSAETMSAAAEQAESFRNVFRRSPPSVVAGPSWDDFVAVLEDDFNTPAALSILHNWKTHGHTDWLEKGLGVFGLESLAKAEAAPMNVHVLAQKRLEARGKKKFGEADTLRTEILEAGWEVRDIENEPGYQLIPKR